MRTSPLIVLLAGCQYAVGLTTPGQSTGTSESCAWRSVGPDGGDLAFAGIVVSFPTGALAAATDVELCAAVAPAEHEPRSEVVELGPPGLALAAPAAVTVPYDGVPESGAVLWAPDAGGALVRQLRGVDVGGVIAAPLYRAGLVLVAYDPRVAEPYVEEDGVADILLVLDNSCSMGPEQAVISQAIPDVLDELEASGVDYHLGVTSTDLDRAYDGASGALVDVDGERWVERSTVDKVGVFERMVSLGTNGAGTEQGLGAAYLALEDLAATTNAGFQREEAQLAVIVVSDEPDLTRPSVVTDVDFVDWFETLKDTPATTWLHGVLDPEFEEGYPKVVDAVGGQLYPIEALDQPAGWTAFMTDVIGKFYVHDMQLAGTPVDGVVEAWVLPADGGEPSPIPLAGFAYDAAANRVQVAGTAPGDEVVILYEPLF